MKIKPERDEDVTVDIKTRFHLWIKNTSSLFFFSSKSDFFLYLKSGVIIGRLRTRTRHIFFFSTLSTFFLFYFYYHFIFSSNLSSSFVNEEKKKKKKKKTQPQQPLMTIQIWGNVKWQGPSTRRGVVPLFLARKCMCICICIQNAKGIKFGQRYWQEADDVAEVHWVKKKKSRRTRRKKKKKRKLIFLKIKFKRGKRGEIIYSWRWEPLGLPFCRWRPWPCSRPHSGTRRRRLLSAVAPSASIE